MTVKTVGPNRTEQRWGKMINTNKKSEPTEIPWQLQWALSAQDGLKGTRSSSGAMKHPRGAKETKGAHEVDWPTLN